MLIQKIISGGQTGVDQAALRAAMDGGVAYGGWCPPGRVCEDGVIPPKFPLVETPAERSPDAPEVPRSQRTEWNVRDSDGTIVLTRSMGGDLSGSGRGGGPPVPGMGGDLLAGDRGTDWTLKCARIYRRPFLVADPFGPGVAELVGSWIVNHRIAVLNVAGPSEATCPGIGEQVYRLLSDCLIILRLS